MKKTLLVLIVLIVIVALAFPISNLLFKPAPMTKLSQRNDPSALYEKAAGVLESKCALCHAEGEQLPFYANFPIAKGLIEADIRKGLAWFDLQEIASAPEGAPVPEPLLAKLEYALDHNTMPPGRFAALHWDAKLSGAEKEDLLAWVRDVRKSHYTTPGVAGEFEQEPVQPLPLEHGQNPEIVALGDKMFHDVRLSHDNSLSCASCHGLDKGGTDQKQFSTGINGQVGDINSPTVFNSAFQFILFWDGRAPTLEAQADGPVNNAIEMGSNWNEAIPKLQAATDVVEAFKKSFPDGLTSENVMKAIATFERSLNTPSRFDKYLSGDKSALTEEEQRGYQLFKEHACATCHSGKILGGQSFERMGINADYFVDRGDVIKRDYGRFNHTSNEKDRFKFKVPTLRNIEKTGPYFHDGTVTDLLEAVKTMGKYQSPTPLTDSEAELIVKFLLSLTGEYAGKSI
ncbi:MAG: hypothetical protein GHCLOJNM_01961 [bacterium]|nr:hypothetical protein [bacterium]